MMNGHGNYTPSSSVEYEIHIAQGDGGAQTEDTTSTKLWLGQVRSRFHSSHQKRRVSETVCIYRVPKQVRISKPDVFDPFVVSLGPFHCKMNSKLSTMDEHKLEAVDITLRRLNMNVSELIAHIRGKETEIRACYEEPIEWDGDTLSWAFAMDACFILEFLKATTRTEIQSDMDNFSLVFQNLPQQNSMYYGIINDIMKMENQIPFFILQSLLREELGNDEDAEKELCLMLVASRLFDGFPFCTSLVHRKDMEQTFEELMQHIQKEPAHLLDLYRMVITDLLTDSSRVSASPAEGQHRCCEWLINICTPPTRSSVDRKFIPRAELLQTAGIKFEPGQIGFRKRRFRKSTLYLPEIRMDDSTITLLRNVMAYEECQRCSPDPKKTVISHYLVLFEYLIDSAKDVSVLRKARVISSLPCSDKDIACSFNTINQGITIGTYEGFEKVMQMAKEHYDSQWNVWISQFQEEHCSKPWYLVSLAAGILLLAMAAVQAVYAVLSYQKHDA